MKFITLIIGLGIVLAFNACQKVIDVDLNDADKKMIIEANFNATDSVVTVKVSYTSSFFDTYVPSTVDDAVVSITDGNGNTLAIPSIGTGQYTLENYIPTEGMTYTINVSHDGVTYSAQSELKPALTMEVPRTEFFELGFFGEDGGYLVFFKFQDPQGIGNYYNVITTANDTIYNKANELVLGDDELTDGNLVERPVFFGYYEVGDTVSFELQAINKKVYDYYVELQTIAGGQSSAAPANPTYFWSNKALGYFSAYYYTKNGVKITE